MADEEVDWGTAHWIGAATTSLKEEGVDGVQSLRLRREWDVQAQLRRATVRVCGLGHYELTIDGRRVGEDLFTPGWTNYRRTCLYDTYDVTTYLQQRPGRHALGVLLGNGMYHIESTWRYTKFTGSFGPLKAILQLRLEYDVGPVEILATDASWGVAPGPITYSHIFGGEDYDARLEAPGWDSPGWATWEPAAVMDGPGGRLRGESVAAPPIRAIETREVRSVTPLREGVAVYDLRQNASMMPRVTVSGEAGALVRVVPGELLGEDGAVDRSSCGAGVAYWEYTLAGRTPCETYFPKFWYHAARYLQVECVAAVPEGPLPVVQSLENVIVHSTCEPVGEFACSSDLLSKTYRLIHWAQRSNMWSLMTDCPHRERLGWLEQTHLNGPALRYNFRLDQLFAKTMNDMAETQLEDGMVTTTAPEFAVFDSVFRNSPEWSSAFLCIPWQQYEFTGDFTLLRLYYDRMARYVAYLASRAENYIVSFGLSDWYDVGPGEPGYSKLTPAGVTGTAFFYHDTLTLAQVADLLHRSDEAAQFRNQAEAIRGAFNARFFHPETRQYATGSQCANAMAIVMGLVDAPHRAGVLENLVADVEAKGITAGDVGYRYLLRALADCDRSDVIFRMVNQSEKPGYGMMLARGATALTEAWDANPRSSQNHFMLGQISEWFFHDLAGIQSDPDGPGFRKVVLKPTVVGDLTWVKASYKSLHGTIVSEWQRTAEETTFTVAIPADTTATVLLPSVALNSVATSPPHGAVTFIKVKDGFTVYEIADAGTFTFTLVPIT